MLDLEKILKAEPTLSPNGIEPARTDEKFDAEDESQIYVRCDDDIQKQIEMCVHWLRNKPRIKTINPKVSDSGIRQAIRREHKVYVSNKAVLEAAKILEIPYKHNPYAMFALSTKILGLREILMAQKKVYSVPKVKQAYAPRNGGY